MRRDGGDAAEDLNESTFSVLIFDLYRPIPYSILPALPYHVLYDSLYRHLSSPKHSSFCLLIPQLPQPLPQHPHRLIQIPPRRVRDTDAHMSDTHILAGNLAMQTGCKDDPFLHESGQQIGGFDVLGQIEGRHTVGLVLGFGGELREAEVGDSLLDFVRGGAVGGEAVGERAREDLREGGVQGVDELGGGRGEVGGFFGFIVLHDCVWVC